MSNPMRERRDPRFYRRPGMGQAGMDLGYGKEALQGAPLLTGPSLDPLTAFRSRPIRPIPIMGALSRAYDQTLKSQKESAAVLGSTGRMVTTDYLNWVPSESGAFGGPEPMSGDLSIPPQSVVATTTRPSAGPSPAVQSLEDLVTNHLTAMRRAYMENGWRRFGAGDYQGALRMFSLAENASLDAPAERAYALISKVYGGIAAGQFAQASNSLEWLVSDSSGSGRTGHPQAFNRIFDDNKASTMADLYVSPEGLAQTAEYQRGNLAVESVAAQNPNLPTARALLAVVEWGRGRRANAIFEARKITDSGLKLAGLASVLEEAERLRKWQPAADQPNSLPAVSPGLSPAGTQPAQ